MKTRRSAATQLERKSADQPQNATKMTRFCRIRKRRKAKAVEIPSPPTTSVSRSERSEKIDVAVDVDALEASNVFAEWSQPEQTDQGAHAARLQELIDCLDVSSAISIPRRGIWNIWEDGVLADAVQSGRYNCWREISAAVCAEGIFRSPKQCRERYVQHLDPRVNKTPLSEAERRRALELMHRFGNRWSTIAALLGNGRTDNVVKNSCITEARKAGLVNQKGKPKRILKRSMVGASRWAERDDAMRIDSLELLQEVMPSPPPLQAGDALECQETLPSDGEVDGAQRRPLAKFEVGKLFAGREGRFAATNLKLAARGVRWFANRVPRVRGGSTTRRHAYAATLSALAVALARAREILTHDDGLPERKPRPNGYLGGAHTYTTLVVDRSTSCATWSKNGECVGANADHVRRMCPMSCNQALAGMRDTERHCSSWALQGACTNNSEYMRNNCPVSCGWALSLCKDLSTSCGRLARRGLCEADPSHMLTMCSQSCGICRSSCRVRPPAPASSQKKKHATRVAPAQDTSTSCPQWIREDWGVDNPATVLPRCSASAGICHELKIEDDEDVQRDMLEEEELARKLEAEGESEEVERIERRMVDEHFPLCADHNRTLCAIWTRAACAMNPGSVIRLCPKMCGACDDLCQDHVHSCADWAAAGALTPNLYHLCAATAGICSRIESVLHYEDKDEL